MKVAEKDSAVLGILEEEYRRCCDVIAALLKKMEKYPKGSLHVRCKKYNGKEYLYHSLVSRDGSHVINRHVPADELPELQSIIEQRDKCKKEMQSYRKRMLYLEKLLKNPKSDGVVVESPA
jgi:hypothetical protein